MKLLAIGHYAFDVVNLRQRAYPANDFLRRQFLTQMFRLNFLEGAKDAKG